MTISDTATITEADVEARTLATIAEVGIDASEVDFRSALWDAGLAFVKYPVGKGGLGVAPGMQATVERTIRDAGRDFRVLDRNIIGIGMGLPTVLTYGTEAHHEKHLKRIFTGEDFWCQMFSEPTHGSDVAGLMSRAERDGDEWVVNGQKVWTSGAHHSRYGMLIVRTDPDLPKHRGMSYFIVDMQSPGIEIRPLYQITGEAEFNEVFFTDVRIPHSNLLGEVGDGWRVATTTLMNERVAIGGGSGPRGAGSISPLVDLWNERKDDLSPLDAAVKKDQITQLWIEDEVGRLTTMRAREAALIGNPGPEGSIGKHAWAMLNQRILNACVDLLGANGTMHEPGYPLSRDGEGSGASSTTSHAFLRSRANTIEGGTSEIMRNILGERVLGLPGDVRVDKDVPWRDIPT